MIDPWTETPTPEDELHRAGDAQRILDDPIFQEACTQIDRGLALQRQRVPMGDTLMHTRLILAEQVWEQIKDYLKLWAQTGEYARFELKRRDTAMASMRRMFSSRE